MPPPDRSDFEAFLADAEPALRRALVAAYGPDVGREVTVEALAWAWLHWERLRVMEHPVGYLFRVGQSASRRWRRRRPRWEERAPAGGEPWVEPGLPQALARLTHHQRVAVVLCHGFEWTHREVAELLGVAPSTVQNHVERGLTKLRRDLEVTSDDLG